MGSEQAGAGALAARCKARAGGSRGRVKSRRAERGSGEDKGGLQKGLFSWPPQPFKPKGPALRRQVANMEQALATPSLSPAGYPAPGTPEHTASPSRGPQDHKVLDLGKPSEFLGGTGWAREGVPDPRRAELERRVDRASGKRGCERRRGDGGRLTLAGKQ